ncbi:hypothetical protein D9V37_06760 [Nocardioides mangrovicus]|uniref:Ribosomally synthesized peptide with SipW-like signal peptide n=1 Tax=Nocardioides mangrovicus TaxID=2478913 RepID=A0A3L8P2T3_9ACTN|nr:hypothetical protein [Nocardioides mangrovicus]RLV49615.1 hypothetical protein D9V37_06760 [Nocardioides mangrovicus]
MNKSRTARLAGFIGALGCSAALVGAAVHTTGAYFTDSKDGSINTSTGSVKVSSPSGTTLNFSDLLPGDYKTQTVSFRNDGTAPEDIWMVMPAGSALTGDQSSNALGRYGHFKLTSEGGAHFVSNNLRSYDDTGRVDCKVDSRGWGGSNEEATSASQPPIAECGAPHAILLYSALPSGSTKTATVEFGFTKLLTGPQGAPSTRLATYKIVATQHGVRPDDVNN